MTVAAGVLLPARTSPTLRMIVTADALRERVGAIALAAGAEAWAADAIVHSLVDAQLVGHDSHGVRLLPVWLDLVRSGSLALNAQPRIVDDHGAVVRVEGHRALGPVVGRLCARIAAERAGAHGISCVIARNASHLGRLGEFTAALADGGQTALLLSGCQGAGQMLAPAGGSDRRLSNNPISIATPGDPYPVVLDMALSAVAEGKVGRALDKAESVPPGWILDSDGKAATDPAVLFAGDGRMVPLGGDVAGHKGVGLIVLVDLIAGILSGGGVCRAEAGDFFNSVVLIAIDVNPVIPVDAFKAEVHVLEQHLKQSPPERPDAPILMPGERAGRTRDARLADGIPLDDADVRALEQAEEMAALIGGARA